ncbi:hypothetical protein PybrP1_012959 [[Pythium] brassicae (nom. inval.)]|nr:hypothetical protein PybrP1_012959 [[Pythium] brassicae (nom. inval.)]
MQARRDVQLHSHDFEWEDLARVCREQVGERERERDEAEADDDADQQQQQQQQQQLAQVAKDKWEVFHQLNNGKAYKSRNYLVKEFPELLTMEKDEIQLLELGCGYGSAVFPILDECPNVRAQVCDFSAHAIRVLQQNPRFDPRRCRAFVCDVARDELSGVAPGSVDIALLVFVLSALPPASVAPTLRKVFTALRPGGLVCFRDYGLYDLAMRRNAKRLSPSLYYRSDGTLAYFFSKADLAAYFERQCGFRALESEYCTVRLTNRKKGVSMDRVWLHAKFQKPW